MLAGRAAVGSEMAQVVLGWLVLPVWSTAPDRGCDRIAVALSSLPAESGFPAAAAEELCALLFIGTKNVCEDTTHTQNTPPMRDK